MHFLGSHVLALLCPIAARSPGIHHPGLLTTCSLVFPKNASAKTETTKTLMMKETKSAMQDSMKKYLLASRTSRLLARFTCLD